MIDFLITGGFGFQGFHLTNRLLYEGYSVRVLARSSEHSFSNYEKLQHYSDLRVQWGDITNEETVRAAVKDCNAIIHLAAQINVDESLLNPERAIAVNVLGTFNVLRAALKKSTPAIVGSSCEVYGSNIYPDEKLMDENHPLNPQSPYAGTKAAADRIAFSFYKSLNLPIVITRPSNVYGPGQKNGEDGALIARWIRYIKDRKPLLVYGSGEQKRDWLYVDDVVEAFCCIIKTGIVNLSGNVFNFGTGIGTSVKDIALILQNMTGIEIIYGGARQGEVKGFIMNSDSALQKLGWQYKIKFEDGVKLTLERELWNVYSNK